MRTYKISKGWAIFIYITAPLLIALFCFILIMPFVPAMKGDMNPGAYWFLIPLSLVMIVGMTIGLIDTIKGRFVIGHDKIFTVSTFSNKQLMFEEIKGYRTNDKYIFIESHDEHKKTIKISNYVAKTNEIMEWLSANYPDLDLVQANHEKEDILGNEAYGLTEELRAEELQKAHRTAKMLNWTGGLIAAWTLFFPNPYEYAIIVSIIFPAICIVVLKYFKGLVRIDERKDTAYPSIFWAIFASTLALALRGLLDYEIFDHSKVWLPTILIAAAGMALLLIGNKEFKLNEGKAYLNMAVLLFCFLGFGYGAFISLNCMYDKSEPELFSATILNKRVSSGKSTTYYFELTPWGQQEEPGEVSVSKDLYNKLGMNNQVTIYFMKGRFDVPWFEITE